MRSPLRPCGPLRARNDVCANGVYILRPAKCAGYFVATLDDQPRGQCFSHIAGALPAFLRIFCQALPEQNAQADWRDIGNGRSRSFQHGRDLTRHVWAVEGALAREHLIQHTTERKDVGAGICLPSNCSGAMYCGVPTMRLPGYLDGQPDDGPRKGLDAEPLPIRNRAPLRRIS